MKFHQVYQSHRILFFPWRWWKKNVTVVYVWAYQNCIRTPWRVACWNVDRESTSVHVFLDRVYEILEHRLQKLRKHRCKVHHVEMNIVDNFSMDPNRRFLPILLENKRRNNATTRDFASTRSRNRCDMKIIDTTKFVYRYIGHVSGFWVHSPSTSRLAGIEIEKVYPDEVDEYQVPD